MADAPDPHVVHPLPGHDRVVFPACVASDVTPYAIVAGNRPV